MQRIIVLLVLMLNTHLVHAELSQEQLRTILKTKIERLEALATKSRLVSAVVEQNNQHLSLKKIKKRDEQWINSDENHPLKKSMSQGRAGISLRKVITTKGDVYNEAFLTDNQGANVAAFPLTSDYWQGDEDKWIKCFNNGNGQVYVGKVELDASTNTKAVQISVPVIDAGKTIGVLVVGVKLDHIESGKLE